MQSTCEFRVRNTTKAIRGARYRVHEVTLIVDRKPFDPNVVSKNGIRIKNLVSKKYWGVFERLLREDCEIVVRLSGLHNDIFENMKYLRENDTRSSVMFHSHDWIINENGVRDNESYTLVNCDKKFLRRLYKRYWFALGYEQRFEGIILPRTKLFELARWSRRTGGKKKQEDLIEGSAGLIDNLYNGFHFRVIMSEELATRLDVRALLSHTD